MYIEQPEDCTGYQHKLIQISRSEQLIQEYFAPVQSAAEKIVVASLEQTSAKQTTRHPNQGNAVPQNTVGLTPVGIPAQIF
ncbi:hypothetical protein GCM10027443_24060 [Pontibacter brevis]